MFLLYFYKKVLESSLNLAVDSDLKELIDDIRAKQPGIVKEVAIRTATNK
jgi:hypothetical protein